MANQRGELEFDLLAERVFGEEYVELRFGNAAVDNTIENTVENTFDSVSIRFPGWRTLPVASSIDGAPPRANFSSQKNEKDSLHHIKWALPTGWSGGYVIEPARENGDASWEIVDSVGAMQTESKFFSNLPWYCFPRYTGPLKFRVVPVSATPH